MKASKHIGITLRSDGVNVFVPNDTIPMGLRRCPYNWGKKHLRYEDRLCSKEQCAMWDDRRQCCGRRY